MIFGFNQDKFYIDFISCSRPHENMRIESDLRAKWIGETGKKLMLGFTGGVDSQAALLSFLQQDIPIETVFLYLPGYNDNEYNQVKVLDQKHGIKTKIVDLNPFDYEEQIEKESLEYDIPGKNNLLQAIFLKMLPDDYDFIQMIHDPFVYVSPLYELFYYQGYYLPEINRTRAFEKLKRTGRNIFYGDTTEFLLSILDDDVFKAAFHAARYFDGNGLNLPGKMLRTVDRWDYYIKPIIYGKYWGDELIYFPKYQGFEKIPFLQGNPKFKKHALTIPFSEFLDFLKTPGQKINRYYENVK